MTNELVSFDITRNISVEDRLRYSALAPEQVLALDNEQKLRFFYSLQASHALLDEVGGELDRYIGKYTDTRILTLIGPPGAGKTALAQNMGAKLQNHEVGEHPFIFLAAPAHGTAKVSWGGVYRNMLAAGQEPLIAAKRSWKVVNGHVKASRRASLAALRDAVEEMLIHRKTKILAIDEILHLLRYGDHEGLMDTLKSLVDAISCQLLLVGSYDLFSMVTSYGQVARRGEIFYLGRYRRDRPDNPRQNDADLQAFTTIVEKLQNRWPLKQVPKFLAIAPELLDVTLGIVGLLKEFMVQCLVLQISNHGEWSSKMLRKALKPSYVIEKIRKEIVEGELSMLDQGFGRAVFSDTLFADLEKRIAC